ncbi:hypothetical protein AGMMS50256_22430 [Betaproteobacteria bacterium]|nr:hypothetical protein AGMMS50256_22430 [Betaproteobacteria bacterium]
MQKILLVEDKVALNEINRRALESEGLTVLTALTLPSSGLRPPWPRTRHVRGEGTTFLAPSFLQPSPLAGRVQKAPLARLRERGRG